MTRLVELSHRIVEGMRTYPGVPGPRLGVHLSREASHEIYAPGTEFHIGRIELVANTGTYLDTPYHRYPDGADLPGCRWRRSPIFPAWSCGPRGCARSGLDRLRGSTTCAARPCCIHTGWDRHFGTEPTSTATPS